MRNEKRSIHSGFLFGILLLVSVGLHFLQKSSISSGRLSPLDWLVRAVNTPVADSSRIVAQKISGFILGAIDGEQLRLENQRLRRLVASFALYQETVDRYQKEIDSLRKLEGMDATYRRKKQIAAITGYFPATSSLKIAAGSSLGVKVGMPVVSVEGLIGKIQAVSGRESHVQLVSSSEFTVGGIATIHNPPPTGLVKGDFTSTLNFTLQSAESILASGDIVYTTGFSELIPRGIPIGRVISVKKEPELGLTRARLLPSANIGNLREVVVLL